MANCSCSGPCSCDASVPIGPRGLPGEAGPANNLTTSAVGLPAGDDPTAVTSGVSPNQHITFGLPAGATGATGPAGPAGTNGTNGTNGWGTAFELLDAFNMPAVGATTGFVTIGDNRMVEVGTWVKITGYSIEGNWFVVVAKSGDDQVQLRNPGPSDLLPYWGASATDVPSNAPPATLFSPGELGVVVGAPGIIGLTGDSGLTPEVAFVYTIPVSPPASPAENLVVYFNAAPPSIPSIGRFYSWNGASWDGGPNFVATGGTTTYTGTADPNVTPPSGAKLLDLYIRFQGNNAVYYQLTAPSTWSVIGTVALLGTTTTAVTWDTAPGTYTIDLAVFSYAITADKDIELDWDTTNYSGQGQWIVAIENIDASPIDLTFAAGQWEEDPALTITPPVAIAAGDIQVIEFIRNTRNGQYCITNFFVATAL